MRPFMAGLGTATLLAALLTGCTQLVPDSGAPTAEPTGSIAEPTSDVAPEPTFPPDDSPVMSEPTPFVTYPARPISKAKMPSLAVELKAGKHPLDRAVPGSERVVFSKRFVGPHEFTTPSMVGGKALFWSTSCLGGGKVIVEIGDDKGFTYGGESGCSPGWGGGHISEMSGPVTVRIHADRDAEIQLDLVAFDEEPLLENEHELIASLGRTEGVDANSISVLANDESTGPVRIVLPAARSGTHLEALISCPARTPATLELSDADGLVPDTSVISDCMSGDAAGIVTWEDPDPSRELPLTVDIEADKTMRVRVFGYNMEGNG